jgi:hypothetical protein
MILAVISDYFPKRQKLDRCHGDTLLWAEILNIIQRIMAEY